MQVTQRVIRKFSAGKKEPQETIVYVVWDKETGEEHILRYGIDAREYLARNPEKYSSNPPAGKESAKVVIIHAEEEPIEQPSLPQVDLPGVETEGKVQRGGKK